MEDKRYRFKITLLALVKLCKNDTVGPREKIEKIIKEKKDEIWRLQAKINEAKIYVGALEDTLHLLPKEPEPGIDIEFRPGTTIYKAREILSAKGEPMHIADLLSALGKPNDNTNRAAVSGSISAYYRKGQVFTRPAPNTFGLVQFPAKASPISASVPANDSPSIRSGPPENFGLDDDIQEMKGITDDEVPF